MPVVMPEQRAIYFHIPKVAGTSITSYLVRYASVVRTFIHRPPWMALEHGAISESILTNYWKFTFVRNPWSRTVSTWEFWGRVHPDKLHGCKTFSDFIKYYYDRKPLETFEDVEGSMWPQHKTTHYPKDPRLSMNFVGKFENLQSDFNIVCDKLTIKKRKLPCENSAWLKGTYPHYSTYYDFETKEMVAKMFQKDIELFNYRFEGQ